MRGEDAGVVPVVSDDVHGMAAVPGADAYEFFEGLRQKKASNWANQVTIKRFYRHKNF
jgi:hypothetical protein